MNELEISDDDADVLMMKEEGHFLDVKGKLIAPAKLSRTISAFCNTAGGEILVGISESDIMSGRQRSWDGFDNVESTNAIIQMLESLAPLAGFWHLQFLRCGSKQGYVMHIVITKTRQIINATSGTPYVRKGAQNLPVDSDDGLARLRLDKGLESFEDSTVSVASDAVTNSVTALEFMLSALPSSEPEPWMRSQFLLHNEHPTVAAALLFSDEPQALLPKRSAIKILQYRTREEGNSRDQLAFSPITVEGPIYDLIKEAVAKARNIVEGIQRLGEHGLEAVSYPDITLHEIITNAVLHRDYSHATDIQIRIYDDRIEVESPGKLPGHVTTENYLAEQFARNPKLVRLINKFPDPPNKDVGEGLNSAFEAMRKIRMKEPDLIEQENSVIVYIRHTRLSSPEQIVVDYLASHATITNQIGRELTGIRRDVQMKDVFVRLRSRGVLEQVPGKKGRATAWQLNVAQQKTENFQEQVSENQDDFYE